MKKWMLLLMVAAGLSSCIYPYTPDIQDHPESTLVVDGHILVGGLSTIRLGYLSSIDRSNTKVPKAIAWIEDDLGNKYTVPGESAPASSFDIPIEAAAAGAQQFRAVVEADGETYASAWITPDPAPRITGIHFTADEHNVHVLVDLEPGVDQSGYAGFLLEETWEFHSDVYPLIFLDEETWEYYQPDGTWEYPFYWCFRSAKPEGAILLDYTTLSGEVIRDVPVRSFLRSDPRNHKRYSILVKGFALSKEAYDYNKQTQEISEVGGDLFSTDPGALKGNLVCETHPEKEVMGYVLAGYVSSRRAFLANIYQLPYLPTIDYVTVPEEEILIYYYDYNFRPVKKMTFADGVTDIGWAHHRCINCLEAGGTQERPDFWDDPEE